MFISCLCISGISVHWILAPPEDIKAQEHFNVSYELDIHHEFWEWAVTDLGVYKPNFFKQANYSGIVYVQSI